MSRIGFLCRWVVADGAAIFPAREAQAVRKYRSWIADVAENCRESEATSIRERPLYPLGTHLLDAQGNLRLAGIDHEGAFIKRKSAVGHVQHFVNDTKLHQSPAIIRLQGKRLVQTPLRQRQRLVLAQRQASRT